MIIILYHTFVNITFVYILDIIFNLSTTYPFDHSDSTDGNNSFFSCHMHHFRDYTHFLPQICQSHRVFFPRYELALKAASKLSDKLFPSVVHQRLVRHYPNEEVDFVCSEHLTTPGNGHHTLHRSVAKHVDALTLPVPPRRREFKISAIIAAICENNIGTKVDPLRITPSRARSSPQPSPLCEPTFENLALVTTDRHHVAPPALVPTCTTFSKSILTNLSLL